MGCSIAGRNQRKLQYGPSRDMHEKSSYQTVAIKLSEEEV
jgi:hypothetical protein